MEQKSVIKSLADELGVTQAEADHVLRALGKVLKAELSAHEGVRLVGIGTFRIITRAARTARNLGGNGEAVPVPERRVIKFKPKPALLMAVRASA